MLEKKEKIHLEIQTSRKSPVGVLRSSYYDNGKIKHRQYGRIKGKTVEELKLLQLAFKGKLISRDDPNAFQILDSKEYGASSTILAMIKDLGLDKVIDSKLSDWSKNIAAMIAGRIIYQGSKLSLVNQFENTCLWQIAANIEDRPDVKENCYLPLDELLKRQNLIQKKLAKKHLTDGHLVLYDITSSYLEGEYKDSEIVKYGYNRDGKKGHEQIVIGLLCSKEGCPVAVEIFAGNAKDESTVIEKINQLKNHYQLNKIIFVGDRGMVTKSNIDKIKEDKDVKTISALTRFEIRDLLAREVIQPDLFDDNNIHEVIDDKNPSKRYCLCKNPLSANRDRESRNRLINLTTQELSKIADYKQATTVEILGSRIGKILQKRKMGKYINWHVKADTDNIKSRNHKVTWSLNQEKIAESESLDGCYIITTDVAKEDMATAKVVANYKRLELVEQAFRNLKTTQLEVRPIYHKKDDRIKSHVFLCMLAYYVQWHMMQRLKPLFNEDSTGANRRWTFAGVIESLRQITKNKTQANGVIFYQNTKLNKNQKKILKYLEVAI